MPKLTKRAVEAIKPTEKDFVVWDDDLPGFGLRVKPSGIKSYIVQYKNMVGRSRRWTIGKHGVVTAALARKDALQIKARVAKGEDPVSQKNAVRVAPTVNQLLDRYLKEHVAVHNKPSTRAVTEILVRRFLRPYLGSLKVASVLRDDIEKLHRKMSSTPRQANLVIATASTIFNLAEVWGMRPDGSNPTRLVKRYPENKRDRFLSMEELGRLGGSLKQAETEQTEQPNVLAVIRLLALTGCRLSEILTLKWDYIDFKQGVFNFPDAKAGARRQALSAAALEILTGIDSVVGVDWVLLNKTNTGPIDKSNMERAWRRIRKRADLEDVRLHDLRHTVGTMAGASGANAFLVRDLLGHKTLAMTGRYVSRDDDPLRDLTNHISNRIAAGLEGMESGEIVTFPRRNKRTP